MKREYIVNLLNENGITDEEIIKKVSDGVFAEYGKEMDANKSKIDAYEKQIASANENIKALRDSVKKFEGTDVDGLKASVKEWETKYNADIEALKTEHSNTVKTYTLKEALKALGSIDADYAIYKMGGVDKFQFNDDGSVFGLEETIKPFREANPAQFMNASGGTGYQPAGGGAPAPDVSKMSYSELCKFLESNPNAKL